MTRLDIIATPVPCAAATPSAAPAQYIDAVGALRIFNGAEALIIYPSGDFCICSALSHRSWWKPEACTPATSGVTLRLRQERNDAADVAADARANFIARLDRLRPVEWRDAVAQEVIEAGGTFPLAYDPTQEQQAEIFLHEVGAYGASIDDAIANWIGLARVDLGIIMSFPAVVIETDRDRFQRQLNRAAAAAGRGPRISLERTDR